MLMELLSTIAGREELTTIGKDLVMQFGDKNDGVIEIPARTKDGGVIEVGYYYGSEKKKYIAGISSQVGCPARCSFCELGSERFGRNLLAREMYEQVILIVREAKRCGVDIDAIEHKVNIAKTGEPMFNKHLLEALEMIATLSMSFKVSTVMPNAPHVMERMKEIARFAAQYKKSVQIQISIISTCEKYRRKTAGIDVLSFAQIRVMADAWKDIHPAGRKMNASLILAADTPCDPAQIVDVLPPELIRFRFRPCIETGNAKDHRLHTIAVETLAEAKQRFGDLGYEVGDWATPTPTELRFGLVSNVTRRRYLDIVDGKM